jgi:hypothetical protein
MKLLAELMFGIGRGAASPVLTGEAGTGKTTLMRHFCTGLRTGSSPVPTSSIVILIPGICLNLSCGTSVWPESTKKRLAGHAAPLAAFPANGRGFAGNRYR